MTEFDEYSIKDKIAKYIDSIKSDQVVFDWVNGLENKGKYHREKDQIFADRMFYYIEQLSKERLK